MKLNLPKTKEFDNRIASVEKFYVREGGNGWTVRYLNKDGDQLGHSEFRYLKVDATKAEQRMAENIGKLIDEVQEAK